MKAGYLQLSDDHATRRGIQPLELKVFHPGITGISYFFYDKYEPEQTALRITGMQMDEKFPHWMGVSLRRLLQGTYEDSLVRRVLGGRMGLIRCMNSYPSTIPPMTPEQKAEPVFQSVEFYYSGVLYLQDYKVVEITRHNQEDYIIPTAKFISDLERGLKFAERIRTRNC